MRIPVPVLAALALVPLLAGACSGNDPQPPLVGAGGWSWSPDVAGANPLPVLWWGTTTPTALPLLDGGDCAASGSVQGLVAVSREPLAVGISVTCTGGVPAMLPVAWSRGGVEALPLPPGASQGTALAVVTQTGRTRIAIPDRYVGGATGTTSPLPTLWKNGAVAASDPALLLPPGHDAGMVTSLAPTENYLLAAGVAHVTGSSPPAYTGLVWIFDLDFTASAGDLLPLPAGVGAVSSGAWVSLVLDGDFVWSASSIAGTSGDPKPVVWLDDSPEPSFGADFGVAPWASPTGLSIVGITPYTSGWVRTGSASGPPEPAIWAGAILSVLPSVDPSNPFGAGEAIAIYLENAYVAGESCTTDPANPARKLAVPALWSNGSRTDLGTLGAPGAGPAISGPIFGWWRIPGTPAGSPPDWPYPGGTGEVLGALPVSASGSGVARAVVALPPG